MPYALTSGSPLRGWVVRVFDDDGSPGARFPPEGTARSFPWVTEMRRTLRSQGVDA